MQVPPISGGEIAIPGSDPLVFSSPDDADGEPAAGLAFRQIMGTLILVEETVMFRNTQSDGPGLRNCDKQYGSESEKRDRADETFRYRIGGHEPPPPPTGQHGCYANVPT